MLQLVSVHFENMLKRIRNSFRAIIKNHGKAMDGEGKNF